MTAHVISNFTRPQSFADRFFAMVKTVIVRLDQLMTTTNPEARPE